MGDNYDVVIIGSGLGGLMCGAFLSKNGFKVVVLEKNREIGGCLQSYNRDGALFDTGVHYIGGLQEGQTLHKIFSYAGLMKQLKINRLNEAGFDIFNFEDGKKDYAFAQSYELFIETLSRSFPKERRGIEAYCSKIRDICDRFPLYNLRSGNYMDKFDVLDLNARETINSFVSDPLLQNVLAGNNSLYAGVGEKTPFYIHALILNSYIESAWRCDGGGAQIATILGDIIQANGGVIVTQADVNAIEVSEKSVTSVLTKDKRRFAGKQFISDLHPATTIALTQTDDFRKSYVNRISSLDNTIGAFALNVVFREASFPYWNYNVYYHSKPENVWGGVHYHQKNWPENFAFFSTRGKDGYAQSATIMSYMRFSELKQWEDSFNTVYQPGSRGSGYNEMKEEKAAKLTDLVERQHPGFKRSVNAHHTLTPLTYRDYTGTPKGSLYGLQRDYREPLKTFVPARTKVSNLFLTGQNLNLHGVLGVSVSSIITCNELLGNGFLLEKIRKIY